eukprot:2883073-Rhodomonas_salina.1
MMIPKLSTQCYHSSDKDYGSTETEVKSTTQNQSQSWTVIESESLSVESITDRTTTLPETLICSCAGVMVTSSQITNVSEL